MPRNWPKVMYEINFKLFKFELIGVNFFILILHPIDHYMVAIRDLLDRSSRKFNVIVVSFAVVFRDVTQQSPKKTPQKKATRRASTTVDKSQTHGKNKNANE